MVRQVRRGLEGLGLARLGKAGVARQDTEWKGEAKQGRHGTARHGKAKQGRQGNLYNWRKHVWNNETRT